MDIQEIITLMDHFDASALASFKCKTADGVLEFKKACAYPAPVTAQASPSPAPIALAQSPVMVEEEVAVPAAPTGSTIKAPLVGTFYHSPSPEEPPFVTPGQAVKKGDTIGLIEAMKMINEVPAPMDCVIEEILVADGALAAYDEPLMRVRES